jgi:uncharacterized protein YkwD
MPASVRRHLHPCPRGRAAVVWRGASILAVSLMSLGPPGLAPLAARAAAAAAAGPATTKAARATTPRPARAPACADANLQPTAADLARIDAATLCLVNRVRAAHRLRPLRFSSPLQGVAAGQAWDMVRGNYFGDESLSGQTPMQRILATAYPARATRIRAAQNIGWATGPLATPAAMVQAWMQSPPHREIMLTPTFHDIGVGVTPAAPSALAQGLAGATYTLEFGQRIFSGSGAGSAARR